MCACIRMCKARMPVSALGAVSCPAHGRAPLGAVLTLKIEQIRGAPFTRDSNTSLPSEATNKNVFRLCQGCHEWMTKLCSMESHWLKEKTAFFFSQFHLLCVCSVSFCLPPFFLVLPLSLHSYIPAPLFSVSMLVCVCVCGMYVGCVLSVMCSIRMCDRYVCVCALLTYGICSVCRVFTYALCGGMCTCVIMYYVCKELYRVLSVFDMS